MDYHLNSSPLCPTIHPTPPTAPVIGPAGTALCSGGT